MENLDMSDFMGYRIAEELFKKNETQSDPTPRINNTPLATVLQELLLAVANDNLDDMSIVLDRISIREQFEKNAKDMDGVFNYLDRTSMSFKDYLGIAFDSLIADNEVLFYAMLYMLRYKRNTAQRLFFDDYTVAKILLRRLAKSADLILPEVICPTYQIYVECLRGFGFVGGVLATKHDLAIQLLRSSYDNHHQFDFAQFDDDINESVKTKRTHPIVIDLDNFINSQDTLSSTGAYSALIRALIVDYMFSVMPWNRWLTEDIIEAFCGYAYLVTNQLLEKQYNQSIDAHVEINEIDVRNQYITEMDGFCRWILQSLEKCQRYLVNTKDERITPVEAIISDHSDFYKGLTDIAINMYLIFPQAYILDYVKKLLQPCAQTGIKESFNARAEKLLAEGIQLLTVAERRKEIDMQAQEEYYRPIREKLEQLPTPEHIMFIADSLKKMSEQYSLNYVIKGCKRAQCDWLINITIKGSDEDYSLKFPVFDGESFGNNTSKSFGLSYDYEMAPDILVDLICALCMLFDSQRRYEDAYKLAKDCASSISDRESTSFSSPIPSWPPNSDIIIAGEYRIYFLPCNVLWRNLCVAHRDERSDQMGDKESALAFEARAGDDYIKVIGRVTSLSGGSLHKEVHVITDDEKEILFYYYLSTSYCPELSKKYIYVGEFIAEGTYRLMSIRETD